MKDVNAHDDSQIHRGAYFYLKNRNEFIESPLTVIPLWQEILLGTHFHENASAIEELTDEDIETLKNLKEISEVNGLPDIPEEYKKNKEIEISESDYDNTPIHLDAKLSELENTYDWKNDTNTATGTCRDLYRELINNNISLYLDDNYNITSGKNADGKLVALMTSSVYFGTSLKVGSSNFKEFNGRYLLVLELPKGDFSVTNDSFLLFKDGKVLSPKNSVYKVEKVLDTKIELSFDAGYFEANKDEVSDFTILVVYNASQELVESLYNKFNNDELTLEKINEDVTRVYIEDKLIKQELPNLYLTVDGDGNVKWDNKILPVQTFYKSTQYIEESLEQGQEIVLTFDNVKSYRPDSGDAAILTIGELNVVNPSISILGNGRARVKFTVSEIQARFFDGSEEKIPVTLILIKNTAGRSVYDEIAAEFVKKSDVVDILSHGKLNLDNYVKKEDLSKYAKKNHEHTEYAKVNHNHDYRYANFHHTHPELVAAVEQLLANNNIDKDEYQTIFNEIFTKYTDELKHILTAAGFESDGDINPEYRIKAEKVLTSEKLIDDINAKIDGNTIKQIRKEDNISESVSDEEIKAFPEYQDRFIERRISTENNNVETVLQYLLDEFEKDTVLDSQVLLENDIPVKLINGPIGGIDKEVTYKAGTPLQTILRDMLLPYLSADKVLDRLVPDPELSSYKFYYYDENDDSYKEIKLDEYPAAKDGSVIYVKVDFKNKYGDCSLNCTKKDGTEYVQRAIPVCKSAVETVEDSEGNSYFKLPDVLSLGTLKLQIDWKVEDKNGLVYDSHGLEEIDVNTVGIDFNVFNKELDIIPNYPDYYIGTTPDISKLTGLEAKYKSGLYQVKAGRLQLDQESLYLVVIVKKSLDENIQIYDRISNYNIKNFFEEKNDFDAFEINELEVNNGEYLMYYYNVLDRFEDVDSNKVVIELVVRMEDM